MPLHIYFIGVCFIASLVFIKNKNWADRYTPFFLLALLAVEVYCYHLKINHKGNNLQYNLWLPIEFSFYTAIISKSYFNSKLKKIVLSLIAIFLLLTIINYVFIQNLKIFSGSTYLAATILLLIASFVKMKELLSQTEIHNPFKEPFFWLITGLITVQLVGIFQFSATDYLFEKHYTLYKALQSINIYLSYFQYTCMLIYFYCKWKIQK